MVTNEQPIPHCAHHTGTDWPQNQLNMRCKEIVCCHCGIVGVLVVSYDIPHNHGRHTPQTDYWEVVSEPKFSNQHCPDRPAATLQRLTLVSGSHTTATSEIPEKQHDTNSILAGDEDTPDGANA